uniref:TRUD domain-containing protein n=1 Tax=Trypanosoma congolense (strain IL3000) TaxID=1068625 RepID=G0V0Q4_TRYCI|nr:conserved hypothetical protein [Trypanosoma congolense IL3000]
MMKVSSKGPIVRWALRKPTSGVVSCRPDWRHGRDLCDEEKNSGLLLRMRNICESPAGACHTPIAVVKAQSSDFQVNEVDAFGTVAVLKKAVKGRWRKISRQKTILVEDDSRTPFSDPSKSFSPRVQSYGEYMRVVGKLPRDTPVIRFVLYRDSHSLNSIENRLGYVLSLQPDCIFLRDVPGGSLGCITQHGVCIGVTKELLPHASRHYNLHPLIFDPHEYHGSDMLGKLLMASNGHHHRILLRCVEGNQDTLNPLMKALCERGFINYFWMDRFGVGTNRLFDMAVLASRGDFHRSLGALLHTVAECDNVHYNYFLRYMNADPTTVAGISKDWAAAAKHMRSQRWLVQLLKGLEEYHEDANHRDGAETRLGELWNGLPISGRARRSAAEFVWNAMASQRLISKGLSVAEGDIVRVRAHHRQPLSALKASPTGGNEYHLVTKEDEEKGIYEITDVVLPVPYGSACVNECLFPISAPVGHQLYEEFARKQNMPFLFSELIPPALSEPFEFYRPLVVKPQNLQVSVIKDPNSFTSLKSDLSVMQERKPIHVGEMDYSSRVREPCVYNVSERFAEKMKEIVRMHKGSNSLAISCYLPAQSSPFAMLREVFDLRHASFHDLYGVF